MPYFDLLKYYKQTFRKHEEQQKKEMVKKTNLQDWIREKTEEKRVLKEFLSLLQINYDENAGNEGLKREDREKECNLIVKCEQVIAIWEEKKGHTIQKSKKLGTMKKIMSTLRMLVPNFQSPLTIAKKTAQEDVANMILIWYAEALLGRSNALKRAIQRVLDAQHQHFRVFK